MIRTAQRRFVRHVCLNCLRNLFLLFLLGFSSIHSLQRQVPESGSTLHQLCIMLASCPSLRRSWRKKPVSWREAEGLVTELWSPRSVTMHWLFSYVTAAIHVFSLCGLEAELQPFSCPCSQIVTHCRKEICWTCLFKASIAAIPLGNAKHPLPTRSLRLLRAAVRSTKSALSYGCIMSSLRSSCRKSLSYVHKWLCPKFDYRMLIVLSLVTCDCRKPVNNCRDWACLNSALEVGLPAFQLPMFAKCDALPRGDLFEMLVWGIHAFCKIYCKPPLTTRSLRSLRAAAPSTSSALCLHHGHPFVAASEKSTCFMQRSKSGLQDLLQYWDCALSCAVRLLQTNVCGQSF